MLLFQQDEERWEDVPAGRGTAGDADMVRCPVDGFAGRDRALRGGRKGLMGWASASGGERLGGKENVGQAGLRPGRRPGVVAMLREAL